MRKTVKKKTQTIWNPLNEIVKAKWVVVCYSISVVIRICTVIWASKCFETHVFQNK